EASGSLLDLLPDGSRKLLANDTAQVLTDISHVAGDLVSVEINLDALAKTSEDLIANLFLIATGNAYPIVIASAIVDAALIPTEVRNLIDSVRHLRDDTNTLIQDGKNLAHDMWHSITHPHIRFHHHF